MGSPWIHLDVGDGKFTPNITWGLKPEEVEIAGLPTPGLDWEVHLMVFDPETAGEEWLKAGARRVIVHLETIKNFSLREETGLAISPSTPVEKLEPYLGKISFIQILAVNPGLAGQVFDKSVLDKIKFIKTRYPEKTVEVDGGINLETAQLAKSAGADIVVSASYIFKSQNPKEAYQELKEV